MTRFEDETFTIEHAGMTAKVEGLSGWRCEACGEVEFDGASARRYAAAGDELVLRDRERQSKEIRRIRRKLGLSQAEAAHLTGGGHNAFSRYERGEGRAAACGYESPAAPGQTSEAIERTWASPLSCRGGEDPAGGLRQIAKEGLKGKRSVSAITGRTLRRRAACCPIRLRKTRCASCSNLARASCSSSTIRVASALRPTLLARYKRRFRAAPAARDSSSHAKVMADRLAAASARFTSAATAAKSACSLMRARIRGPACRRNPQTPTESLCRERHSPAATF